MWILNHSFSRCSLSLGCDRGEIPSSSAAWTTQRKRSAGTWSQTASGEVRYGNRRHSSLSAANGIPAVANYSVATLRQPLSTWGRLRQSASKPGNRVAIVQPQPGRLSSPEMLTTARHSLPCHRKMVFPVRKLSLACFPRPDRLVEYLPHLPGPLECTLSALLLSVAMLLTRQHHSSQNRPIYVSSMLVMPKIAKAGEYIWISSNITWIGPSPTIELCRSLQHQFPACRRHCRRHCRRLRVRCRHCRCRQRQRYESLRLMESCFAVSLHKRRCSRSQRVPSLRQLLYYDTLRVVRMRRRRHGRQARIGTTEMRLRTR